MSKLISVKEEAYDRLKRLKSKDDSFSDVILRLTSNKDQRGILAQAGIFKDEPEITDAMEAAMKANRKRRMRRVVL